MRALLQFHHHHHRRRRRRCRQNERHYRFSAFQSNHNGAPITKATRANFLPLFYIGFSFCQRAHKHTLFLSFRAKRQTFLTAHIIVIIFILFFSLKENITQFFRVFCTIECKGKKYATQRYARIRAQARTHRVATMYCVEWANNNYWVGDKRCTHRMYIDQMNDIVNFRHKLVAGGHREWERTHIEIRNCRVLRSSAKLLFCQFKHEQQHTLTT